MINKTEKNNSAYGSKNLIDLFNIAKAEDKLSLIMEHSTKKLKTKKVRPTIDCISENKFRKKLIEELNLSEDERKIFLSYF